MVSWSQGTCVSQPSYSCDHHILTKNLRYAKEMEKDRGFCDIWVNLFRAAFANVELG